MSIHFLYVYYYVYYHVYCLFCSEIADFQLLTSCLRTPWVKNVWSMLSIPFLHVYDYFLSYFEKSILTFFQLQIPSAAALKLLTSSSSTPWVMNAWNRLSMFIYVYCLFCFEKSRFSLLQLQIPSAAALKLLTSCSSTPWFINEQNMMSILFLYVYVCLLPILL